MEVIIHFLRKVGGDATILQENHLGVFQLIERPKILFQLGKYEILLDKENHLIV